VLPNQGPLTLARCMHATSVWPQAVQWGVGLAVSASGRRGCQHYTGASYVPPLMTPH
jgi:hypothetical protein